MSHIAGVEADVLRGRSGTVVIRSRIVLSSAIVGVGTYPLKRAHERREFISADKEATKIAGRIQSVLRELPIGDLATLDAALDDVFNKSNLDFRFAVSMALTQALAEEREVPLATLVGGEFLTNVPIPIVRVAELVGPFSAPISLLPTGPIGDEWYLDPPLDGEVSFDPDQPDLLARKLEPALSGQGLLVDLRDASAEGSPFDLLAKISPKLFHLLTPEQVATLGKLSPPNLTQILDHTIVHLDLDQYDIFRSLLQPILPVKALIIRVPAGWSLSRVIEGIQSLEDEGFKLGLDLRGESFDLPELFELARGLRMHHVWLDGGVDISLEAINRMRTLGRGNKSVVYRSIVAVT